MVLMALDTSRGATSLALAEHGNLIAQHYDAASNQQAGRLLLVLDELLHKANINVNEVSLFAITTGPGGFTSVRIGIAAVRGLAFACGVPCHGVPSLELMAYFMQRHAEEGAHFECIIPAGRADHAVQSFTIRQGQAVATDAMQLRSNSNLDTRTLRCSTDATHGTIIMPPADTAFLLADYMHHHRITEYSAPTPLYIRPPDASVAAPLLKTEPLS
jgi:tRNA threonylcarbamoyl adenosine modification protein YeaZ